MHRLDNTLQSLRCVSGVGEALWFGFGVKHVLRTLIQTAEGASCIMLCSSLTETHSAEYSAKVLLALTDLYSSSQSPSTTPSLRQWFSIVNTCSGTLASSPFGVLVEQIMSFTGDSHVADRPERLRVAGDPGDLARALKALGEISTGDLTSMTVTGGAECGWIAAVAYWFFELSIEIKDPKGEILYRSSQAEVAPKVTVIYTKQEHQTVQVIGVAYVIRDIPQKMLHQNGIYGAVLNGRVAWDKAIQQTFGDSARRLLRMTDFGNAVGSAARIFHALYRVESKSKLSILSRRIWSSYTDASHGRGFINLMINQLPETAAQKSQMETAFESSYSQALAEYEVALIRIGRTCACFSGCCEIKGRDTPESDEVLLQPFCFSILCETLIRLVLHISTYCHDDNIQPSRVGLERLYNLHLERFQSTSRKELYHNAQTLLSDLGFETAVSNAALIFTGQHIYSLSRSDRQYHKPAPAAVVSGICFYLGILQEYTDAPESAARVHIIPGRVESRSSRSFDFIDDAFEVSRAPLFTYSASHPIPMTPESLVGIGLLDTPVEFVPIVEETTSGLSVYFHVNSALGTAAVGPLLLAEQLVRNSGVIACNRSRCSDVDLTLIPMAVSQGEGQLSAAEVIDAGHKIVLRQVMNDPFVRGLALFVKGEEDDDTTGPPEEYFHPHTDNYDPLFHGNSWEHTTEIIIQRDECLSCTLRTAVELSSSGGVTYVVLRPV